MIIQKTTNSNRYYRNLLYVWSIVALVLICYIISGVILFKNYQNLHNQQAILKEQFVQEERELSLEYAIGYWFINQPEEISDSILYAFLVDNGAWYPEILLKQAKIESGNYSSNIFKSNHNLYGMRKVYKRHTTQCGELHKYGVYKNWCLSAIDRILWDKYTFKDEKPSREVYINTLKLSTYAIDTNYINKII